MADEAAEAKAMVSGMVKGLARQVPVLGTIIDGVDAYLTEERFRAVAETQRLLAEKLEVVADRLDPSWLRTEEGKRFAAKAVESAADVQLSDKRELFINAFIHGVSGDHDSFEKMRFIDLLRSLSRDSLDLLCVLHKRFSGMLDPAKGMSRDLQSSNIAAMFAPELGWDPYRVESAFKELSSAGLFSGVTRWATDDAGNSRALSSYPGEAYTQYTERFVQFIKNPTSDS